MFEKKELTISAEPTLDPLVCRFHLNREFSKPDEALVFVNARVAENDPFVSELFSLGEIKEVLVQGKTLTLAKTSPTPWTILGPKVGAVIRAHATHTVQKPIALTPLSDEELKRRVMEVIEAKINPGLSHHGGNVEVVSIQNSNVTLKMSGGCQGCAASSFTLKMGIEKTLRLEIPEIGEISDATDHASGANPYYKK